MKSIAKLVLMSIIGGAITLGGYKAFFEKPEVKTYIETAPQTQSIRAAYFPANEDGFVSAAEKTVNSVVHVKTAVRSRYRQPQSPLEYFFGLPNQGEQGQLRMGAGSGVIISTDGYVVTNNHVIENAEEIILTMNNGKEFKAEVIGADPTTDIALLKVDGKNLPYLEFSNSNNVRVGEWVLAVGNPFNLNSTVTAGIVSAKARNIGIINERSAIESFIQTDAAVNPGNSGGALVNTNGELVGINSAISTHTGSFEGYSFAVPSNLAKKVVEDLREFGQVQRAFIGVSIGDLTPQIADEMEIDLSNGVVVGAVTENGAAQEAGIEAGDVITAVDKRQVTKSSELQEIIGGMRPGENVDLTVFRDGAKRIFNLTLKNAQGKTNTIKRDDMDFLAKLGGSFRAINEEEKRIYNLDYGVKVTSVRSGVLNDQNIPEGFIITSINQKRVKNANDIELAIKAKPKDHPVVILGMLPNGREKYYAFGF